MRKLAVAAVLAVFLAASVHSLSTDPVDLTGIEATPRAQDAKATPVVGKGYAELFLGSGMSELNDGWYWMTDAEGYDNIASLQPAISTDSVDAVIGIRYYWPLKWPLNGRLWWGAGFTVIYPLVQALNGATTIGGSLGGLEPANQNEPEDWFAAPTIFSFDGPLRIALTSDLLITLTPSLLGAVTYDSLLEVTYFGVGVSGGAGLTWYFSKRFGASFSVGYRYIYCVSDTYSRSFASDIMYNTYTNDGFFGLAGLVFRF